MKRTATGLLGAHEGHRVALLLVEYRKRAGLHQGTAGALSGVGEKTISSFETGWRSSAIRLGQLLALLGVYGIRLEQFAEDMAAPRGDRSVAA